MSNKAFRKFNQIISLKSSYEKDGRNLSHDDLDIIEDGSIIFDKEKIIWVGGDKDFPSNINVDSTTNYENNILLPELVDSHTHLIFGGNRAVEYAMRLNGCSYEEIANAGGGILNTTLGTNALLAEDLFQESVQKIERINSYGVGTIEIKSGYGLNFDKEYELSLIIDRLKNYFKDRIQIFNTYMAAHAVPREYKNSKDYMAEVVIPLLEKLSKKNIIDAVDIFHEVNYFDQDDVKLLFDTSKKLNIPLKAHVDEFNDNKGAILAAKYSALSADHLLMTSDDGIKALASSNTVATLLPGTGFFLGKKQANGRLLLDAGCKVAIASDYNPGSCHWDNVLAIASMAAPQYSMNLAELITSITLNASHALGLKKQGAIVKGLSSRFSIFNTRSLEELTYSWGKNLHRNV
jgi:imidazolonepropionase